MRKLIVSAALMLGLVTPTWAEENVSFVDTECLVKISEVVYLDGPCTMTTHKEHPGVFQLHSKFSDLFVQVNKIALDTKESRDAYEPITRAGYIPAVADWNGGVDKQEASYKLGFVIAKKGGNCWFKFDFNTRNTSDEVQICAK